jgi:hypothetical protein
MHPLPMALKNLEHQDHEEHPTCDASDALQFAHLKGRHRQGDLVHHPLWPTKERLFAEVLKISYGEPNRTHSFLCPAYPQTTYALQAIHG